TIKWSEGLKNHKKGQRKIIFSDKTVVRSLFRPFVKKYFYADFTLNDRLTNNHREIFGYSFDKPNIQIGFLSIVSSHPLAAIASRELIDFCTLKQGNGGTQGLPLYRYDKEGQQTDNITDWAVQQFTDHYTTEDKFSDFLKDYTEYDQAKYTEGAITPESNFLGISKEDIFHYVYAVLHNPEYRKKYELNLKREFPRIPLYDHFYKWVKWGEQLMNLHINYETVKAFPLKIITTDTIATNAAALEKLQKPKLKADKAAGTIELDGITTLTGIPAIAWQYKLGNRSALEWILDQYKEKKPTDPTIAEKFNTYKFADYKDQVIDLLKKVCTVSVETMEVVGEMEEDK
ncbi:MAG: type ISP restriction/modification enzyme, partial [Ferruginibacter sp.]